MRTAIGSKRARISAWLRDAAESARRRRGALRAWHIYSNADEAVQRARTETVDRAVAAVAAYLERLRSAGVSAVSSPRFAAYALVALVVALGRDTALEESVSAAKVDGIIVLAQELCGFVTLSFTSAGLVEGTVSAARTGARTGRLVAERGVP